MQKGWARYLIPFAKIIEPDTSSKTKALQDPMNKIVGKHQVSVSTRSFSSSRHSGATVVGTTYRLPDVMVYLSAQEGSMKITRRSRPQSTRKAQERGVPNTLAPTQTR